MDLGIQNKVALILASSKGLGKAVAMELAKEGVKVKKLDNFNGVLYPTVFDKEQLITCLGNDPASVTLSGPFQFLLQKKSRIRMMLPQNGLLLMRFASWRHI